MTFVKPNVPKLSEEKDKSLKRICSDEEKSSTPISYPEKKPKSGGRMPLHGIISHAKEKERRAEADKHLHNKMKIRHTLYRKRETREKQKNKKKLVFHH